MTQLSAVSVPGTFFKIMTSAELRGTGFACIKSIFYNFFYRQYKANLFRGSIPVAQADHPLDAYIPFTPGWVGIYLDFVSFWVRMLGFLLAEYGERGIPAVRDFLASMGKLYAFAAEVYSQHLSTTRRPRYLAKFRFVLIHLADPHLMCIPSLHVMVVIRTYTQFREIVKALGDAEPYAPQIEAVRQGALAITGAILYVKQHSVNCISAAMYAMTRFDEGRFPEEEAADFVSRLFTGPGSPAESPAIREHIIALYRRFLREGRESPSWKDPLLAFLKSLPVSVPAGLPAHAN
jgi:hypothetical protein